MSTLEVRANFDGSATNLSMGSVPSSLCGHSGSETSQREACAGSGAVTENVTGQVIRDP